MTEWTECRYPHGSQTIQATWSLIRYTRQGTPMDPVVACGAHVSALLKFSVSPGESVRFEIKRLR